MAVFISRLIPNPAGKDAEGERITLFNDSTGAVSVSGWSLSDASGKAYIIGAHTIESGGEYTLEYAQTKISLNNTGDTLTLKDAAGNIIDSVSYTGSVADDVILARTAPGETLRAVAAENTAGTRDGSALASGERGAFSGYAATVTDKQNPGGERQLGEGAILSGGGSNVVALAVAVSLVLTGVFWYVFKKVTAAGPAE